MLYCFSQAAYSDDELTGYFATMTKNDAIVLWQDGVLLAIKYPHYFKECKASCFVLEQDISARNLTALLPQRSEVRPLSLMDFVKLTEQFFPQIAL